MRRLRRRLLSDSHPWFQPRLAPWPSTEASEGTRRSGVFMSPVTLSTTSKKLMSAFHPCQPLGVDIAEPLNLFEKSKRRSF